MLFGRFLKGPVRSHYQGPRRHRVQDPRAKRHEFERHECVLYTPTPKARLELSPKDENLERFSRSPRFYAEVFLPVCIHLKQHWNGNPKGKPPATQKEPCTQCYMPLTRAQWTYLCTCNPDTVPHRILEPLFGRWGTHRQGFGVARYTGSQHV